ncbi:hypothetical protein FRC10_001787 [Ceratobasidium sp. 414]|nr:hypothetical protein FRC10_001787 [Ceratobasidium sp. 414]
MPKDEEDADCLCDQDKAVCGRADFRTLSQCVEAIAQQLAELTSRIATPHGRRSYLEPLGSTATGTLDRSAHVTPEPPAIELGAADITHAAEDGVSGQADVSMNDPGIHLALDVAGQEALVRPIIPSIPNRQQILTVVILQDFRATETRNEDVESAGFEGAMTCTRCGEGQARQAVVSDPAIQAGEPHATESLITSKSPTPSCDLQPTKPAEEQPPVTVAAAVPLLRDENPSTTKLWKFSERL